MASVVYVIEAGGLFKIGVTTDVKSRLDRLQCGSPAPLVLVGVMDGTTLTEQALHAEFAHRRVRGEWFALTPDEAESLRVRLRPLDLGPRRKPGRPKGAPTMVVRLPTDVVTEMRRRADRKGLTLGEYLRAALR